MSSKFIAGISTLILLISILSSTALAEMLTIGGTGSSEPLIQKLFDKFQKQQPSISLKIVSPPLGSNGSIRALKAGRIDLAVAGRPLSSKDLELTGKSFKLASTPFVMASKDVSLPEGFTMENLAAIYNGTLRKWPSGKPIRLIIRGKFESDTLMLKSMSPLLAKAVDSSFKRPGMITPKNDLETVSLLAKTHGSLAPTTMGLLSSLDENLIVFSLNGVKPSTSNLINKSYPWKKELTILTPPKPTTATIEFINFLISDDAQKIMLDNDYLPADQ